MSFARHYAHLRPQSAPRVAGYYPDQVAQAYGFPAGVDPAGYTVGIIELGGQDVPSDLQTFCQTRGLPVPTVTRVLVNGATVQPDPNGADVEVALDIEVAAASFPGCPIKVYYCNNTEADFVAGVTKMLAECDVGCCSWGAPEDQWSSSGAQSMSTAIASSPAPFLAASGDAGSSDGESGTHVDLPASIPGTLACGGTSLPAGTNGLPDLTAETAWKDGGGGKSSLFAKPTYQASETLSGTMRGVPDVAACADPSTPYNIYCNSQWVQVGGTSAVPPLLGPLYVALKAKLKRTPPDFHSVVYTTGACRDILKGSDGAYKAGPGYDLVTGNGVPVPDALYSIISGVPTPSPVPPPSPPPVSPPPAPTPAPTPVSLIMAEIDQAFETAIAEAQSKGETWLVYALTDFKKGVDASLPSLLTTLEGALWQIILNKIQSLTPATPLTRWAKTGILERLHEAGLGKRALPSGTALQTILQFMQTLFQDLPQILTDIQSVMQLLQGLGIGGSTKKAA